MTVPSGLQTPQAQTSKPVIQRTKDSTALQSPLKAFAVRRYFTGTAILTLIVSTAGFVAAIAHPAGRHAPLTLLLSLPIEGAVIGPGAAWHHLVAWLAR
jgi:hypothetical protein